MKITKLYWLAAFALIGAVTILVSIFVGDVSFVNGDTVLWQNIVLHLRLPRTLSAFVTGGLLALAGAIIQVLLRNPLADPYILGVSGGAAVASLVFILCGLTGYGLTGAAWIGSLFSIFLLITLTGRKTVWSTQRLLLTGIALASGFSAVISFILMMSPDKELHGMLFWLLGDLSFSHWPFIEGGILLAGLIASLVLAKKLNILVRGEEEARALGVNAARLERQLYFLGALLTAAAVALAGCVGFVGLIVPHLVRLLCGYDHRFLLPGSVLLGGGLLTAADTLSRTLFAPEQLPVGITMSLIGIPVFLFLLHKNKL